MYKRRTARQIKMDIERGAGKLEHEKATKEAESAFRHKAYGCTAIHKATQTGKG